jgi:hypothetical protein
VLVKGAAGGAQPLTRPRGPPEIGGVPAGVSRPPVSGVAPAGAGRPRVNGGAPAGAGAAWSGDISVLHNGLIVMQTQVRVMLAIDARLLHGKTAATPAAARPSAASEALREHRDSPTVDKPLRLKLQHCLVLELLVDSFTGSKTDTM